MYRRGSWNVNVIKVTEDLDEYARVLVCSLEFDFGKFAQPVKYPFGKSRQPQGSLRTGDW